jgi:phosphate transport system substrate-binding protein
MIINHRTRLKILIKLIKMKKSNFFKTLSFVIVSGALLVLASCGGGKSDSRVARSERMDILGAGATFPAPLLTAMADEYRDLTNARVTVNYQSIGSGGGIRQFIEQTIMFGMSEAFLSDEVLAEIEASTGGKAFNMPITLADVVPTYNIPGIEKGLVFNADVLVDLFLGNITNWNDPRIAALNPTINLPSLPITIVHRSDGSGTTNIWTSYLSAVSVEWRTKIGFGTSVNWPTGVGGNGNEGVAGAVMNSPGAIGYNSLSYAIINDMPFGSVINAAGNTIVPSFAATTEAANIELPEDTRVLFTNTPAENGYPIAGFAWMLVYEHLDKNNAIKSKNEAVEVVEFLVWAITDGQELSEELGFARLPQAAVDRNLAMIKQIKWEGELIGKAILSEKEL